MISLTKNNPLLISTLLHLGISALFFGLHFSHLNISKKNIAIEVFEIPPHQNSNLQLQPSKPKEAPKPEPIKEKPREVFGLSRKAITDDSPNGAAVEVKAGNTVAKENDNLKLNDKDLDSIPIPADDYLVTSMPVLVTVVRIPYPPQAKKADIQGAVLMEMIVDDQGTVRDVKVIRGPGYGLDEAAVEAMKKAKFRPGKIGEKAVAVKFRYKYVFEIGSE